MVNGGIFKINFNSKAVKFALNALNEFNLNTNFSPRSTVFLKKMRSQEAVTLIVTAFFAAFSPHFHRI